MDIEQKILNLQPHKIDPTPSNKKYTFVGGPGTRKTTVGTSFPNSILAATERGYLFIDGVIKWDIINWGDFLEFQRALCSSDEIKEKYQMVVLDRADTLYAMAKDSTCARLGINDPGDLGFGKGWNAVKKAFNTPISRLERAGYGICFILHDKILYNNKMEATGFAHDLEKNARSTIMSLSDLVFHLRTELLDPAAPEKGRTVYAYSQAIDVDTKSRARYLTPKFEFTYDNLVKELETAIEKQVKIEGIELKVKERAELESKPFNELKEEVIGLIRKVLEKDLPEKDEMGALINSKLKGKKVSEVPETYYEQLLIIKEYILMIL